MRYYPLLITGLLIISFGTSSQSIQWADEVVRYSSQYSSPARSAEQVLGKPNAEGGKGSDVAWAPSHEDNRFNDYIHVKFRTAIKVRQVAIWESLNPGSIVEIYLYDTRNRQHLVYREEPETGILAPEGRVFRKLVDPGDYFINEMKVVLNTGAVAGWQQIDAIAISNSDEPIQSEIETLVIRNEGEIKPENLGPLINSPYDEMLPIISPDGKTLYFARKFHPQNIHDEGTPEIGDDIWMSQQRPDGSWDAPVHLTDPLNNKFHNYVASVSPDGNRLWLANQYLPFGEKEGVSFSEFKQGNWQSPENLRMKSFHNYSKFSCYTVSTDGNTILMALQRDDTYGDMDLYVSFRENGLNWSAPVNLGPTINTASKEGSVFLAADGQTIYFASEGHAGYGGFDMYMSRRQDDSWQQWSAPLNLGPRINSSRDDFYYTIPASGDYAYFSSAHNAYGGADIYRIPLPQEVRPLPVTLLAAQVVDEIGVNAQDVKVSYINSKTGSTIADYTTDEGKFQYIIPKDNVALRFEKEGYFPTVEYSDSTFVPDDVYLDYSDEDLVEELRREMKNEMREDIRGQVESEFAERYGLALESKNETPPTSYKDLTDWEASVRKEVMEELQTEIREELFEEYGDALKVSEDELAQAEAEMLEMQDGEMNPSMLELRKMSLKQQLEKEIEAELVEETIQSIEREESEDQYVEIEKNIELIPIREGQIIRLNNVFFTANKYDLRPESYESLNNVVHFLNKNPNVIVEVSGHTNGIPNHEFCDKLSNNRAETVRDYLVRQGIAPNRLVAKGYGKRDPIASNETLAGRKKNQRVELRILEVN